jgi:hypothetical protein
LAIITTKCCANFYHILMFFFYIFFRGKDNNKNDKKQVSPLFIGKKHKMRKRIRLTENQINRMVKESMRAILK